MRVKRAIKFIYDLREIAQCLFACLPFDAQTSDEAEKIFPRPDDAFFRSTTRNVFSASACVNIYDVYENNIMCFQ